MVRTTIMADEATLEKLKALADQLGVSLAEVVRTALSRKAEELQTSATCLGSGSSGRRDVSERAGVGRTEPR